MYTAKQIEAAIGVTLAKARTDVVESWASAESTQQREILWAENKALDRIEEKIRHDFASILERAAGGD